MIITDNFGEKTILLKKSEIKKNETFEMHCHDFIEIEVILQGEAEHICNSDKTIVKHGDCYIITPHDFHAFRAKTDIVLWNIHFDINILDNEVLNALTLISTQNFHGQFSETELLQICQDIETIQSEQKSNLPLSNTISKSLIHNILVRIIRASANNIKHTPSLIQKIISYVHMHFRENLSLSAISSQFSCTPSYIGKLFSKHTGMSFNNYLNQIRLKYACNMLRFSKLPINEIAFMAGYSSIEYFFYVFKHQIGTTPLNYRKSTNSDI